MGIAEDIADALDILGAVYDALVDAFNDLLFTPFANQLADAVAGVIWLITYTPAPEPSGGFIFGRPTNGFWPRVYDFYMGTALPAGLLILFLSYIVTQFGAAWGFTSTSSSRGMKKNFLNGLFILPGAWYLSVILLQFSQALVKLFAPGPAAIKSELGSILTGSFLGGGILLAAGGTFNFTILAISVIVNLLRVFATVMIIGSLPILLGFAYGQVPILKNLGSGLYTALPKLAFMSLPTAIAMKMSMFMLNNGNLQIDGVPVAISELVQPLIFIVPAVFGIVVPVLMYNMQLYEAGGMAASRAFGVTSSAMGTSDKSASERTVGNAREIGGSVKEAGGSVSDMAGSAREKASDFQDSMEDMRIENSDAVNEDRLDWGEGADEMDELNEQDYLEQRDGELELPEDDEYFEDTTSESQQWNPDIDGKTDFGEREEQFQENGDYFENGDVAEASQADTNGSSPEIDEDSPEDQSWAFYDEEQDPQIDTAEGETTTTSGRGSDSGRAPPSGRGSRESVSEGSNSGKIDEFEEESVSAGSSGNNAIPEDENYTPSENEELFREFTSDSASERDVDYQGGTWTPDNDDSLTDTVTSTPTERETHRDTDYEEL